jgi:hypothetical protein
LKLLSQRLVRAAERAAAGKTAQASISMQAEGEVGVYDILISE